MSDEKPTKPDKSKDPTQTPAKGSKKEPWAPLPPGKAGNPMKYVPIPKDQQKKRGPAPRKGLFAEARKKVAAKKKGPRTLPPLTLTRDEYKDVFVTIEDMEDALNAYRDECEKTGDMPTLTGFCLSCGGNSTLLDSYIDGADKSLARAAQAVADWIVEQMDQAVIGGTCPVNYAQHIAINQHKRVNSRTYTESNNKSVVDNQHTLAHIIDKADTGGLPAPPSAVKRIGASTGKQSVIEMEPVRDTKGQSRPGTKAATRSKGKDQVNVSPVARDTKK